VNSIASLKQRKHLFIRAIGIPRANQLTTRAHKLTGPAQYRAHMSVARNLVHDKTFQALRPWQSQIRHGFIHFAMF